MYIFNPHIFWGLHGHINYGNPQSPLVDYIHIHVKNYRNPLSPSGNYTCLAGHFQEALKDFII